MDEIAGLPKNYDEAVASHPAELSLYEFIAKGVLLGSDAVAVLGCGAGFGPASLADLCSSVRALDVDAAVLEHAQRHWNRPNISYLDSDFAKSPSSLGDNSIDVVVALNFIAHCGDPARLIEEISRILKFGGRLVFSLPAGAGRDEILKHLEAAKFLAVDLYCQVNDNKLRRLDLEQTEAANLFIYEKSAWDRGLVHRMVVEGIDPEAEVGAVAIKDLPKGKRLWQNPQQPQREDTLRYIKDPSQISSIQPQLRRLESLCRLYERPKVLDVGCMTGYAYDYLKRAGIETLQYWGVDSQETLVKMGAVSHPYDDFKIQEGDLYDLPFEDNFFDVSACLRVLLHVPHPDQALRELLRVTKGFVLLAIPLQEPDRFTKFIETDVRGSFLYHRYYSQETIRNWAAAEPCKVYIEEAGAYGTVTLEKNPARRGGLLRELEDASAQLQNKTRELQDTKQIAQQAEERVGQIEQTLEEQWNWIQKVRNAWPYRLYRLLKMK